MESRSKRQKIQILYSPIAVESKEQHLETAPRTSFNKATSLSDSHRHLLTGRSQEQCKIRTTDERSNPAQLHFHH